MHLVKKESQVQITTIQNLAQIQVASQERNLYKESRLLTNTIIFKKAGVKLSKNKTKQFQEQLQS